MRVTIVGGGVCGLALAHQLAPDHAVTVLEASPGPRGGGYMIDFFGPGFVAAERMGLIDALRSRGRVFRGVRYVGSDDSDAGRIDASALIRALNGRYFSILRPEVERALLSMLPGSVDLRYGAAVRAVRTVFGRSARAQVELADGEPLDTDLVIGCDGVRSTVREHVTPGREAIVPMGFRAASFIFEDAALVRDLGDWAMMTDTVDRIGGLYACDETRAAVLLAERTSTDQPIARPVPDPDRLRATYSGLHPWVDRALAQTPRTFYDDLVAQTSSPRWSRGRVTLAGDAAHAVSLLAGQGTSLAIAGAEVLARCLRAAGPHVEVGLAEYERRWRPVVEQTQRSGRMSAAFFVPGGEIQRRLLRTGRWLLGRRAVGGVLARRGGT